MRHETRRAERELLVGNGLRVHHCWGGDGARWRGELDQELRGNSILFFVFII